MNPLLLTGIVIVTCALACYSIAVFSARSTCLASNAVLAFLTAGVALDITSTIFMIVGSPNIPITVHGMLGYSALSAMLVDAVLVWKARVSHGARISRGLCLYTTVAYGWWVVSFVAGGVIASRAAVSP